VQSCWLDVIHVQMASNIAVRFRGIFRYVLRTDAATEYIQTRTALLFYI